MMGSADRGPGVTSHDLPVKVRDILAKWLFARRLLLLKTSRVRRTAAGQQAIGIAAAELLEEI